MSRPTRPAWNRGMRHGIRPASHTAQIDILAGADRIAARHPQDPDWARLLALLALAMRDDERRPARPLTDMSRAQRARLRAAAP